MFQQFEGMIQKVTSGEIDSQSVNRAAATQVGSMDHGDVQQQVRTAADNAQSNGSPAVASQLFTLVQQHASDPQALKSGLIALLTSHPEIIQHFAPEFAQRILDAL